MATLMCLNLCKKNACLSSLNVKRDFSSKY